MEQCRVHPRNVKNERVRKVFEAAITLGDTIVCKVTLHYSLP
jgi:hypothetical protein